MKFEVFIKGLRKKKPTLAVLVDPDKYDAELISLAQKNHVSCFLVGGSKLKKNNIGAVIKDIKKRSTLPVIIFPGDEKQVSSAADGILILSLLSGNNPEYLIGKHLKAAPLIRKAKLSSIPVAYLLIDGGKKSTTQKVSGTKPLKSKDVKAIKNTSITGELLGFKAIYLEAGSGAGKTVSANVIREVKKSIGVPLIVGGGIDSFAKAKHIIDCGANMIVVGNALEKNKGLIIEIGKAFN